jgi:hypothetical protein
VVVGGVLALAPLTAVASVDLVLHLDIGHDGHVGPRRSSRSRVGSRTPSSRPSRQHSNTQYPYGFYV